MIDRSTDSPPSARRSRGDRRRTRGRAAGFTLVELMISIAMVLILLVGVNKVFKMSADTVGSGMAVSGIMRDLRAARQTLTNDLGHMTPGTDAPFLIIYNQSQLAAQNLQDFRLKGTPTAATLAANNEQVELLAPNAHNHRLDIFQFFVSNASLRRQSGTMVSGDAFQGDLTSSDGWMWFGHLRLPNNTQDISATAAYQYPFAGTAATNQNNLYANQWILGRMAMLFLPKDSSTTVRDSNGINQWHTDFNPVVPIASTLLQPLAYNSPVYGDPSKQVSVGNSSSKPLIASSFTDIAGVDLGTYRANVLKYYNGAAPANANTKNTLFQQVLSSTTGAIGGPTNVYRFAGKPWLSKNLTGAPVSTSAELLKYETALEAPVFLRGCSQFIVEYAGDYVVQNATTGDTTATAANPQTPELDWDPVYDSSEKVVGRRVRWYGMARNSVGADPSFGVYADVLPVWWYRTNPTVKDKRKVTQNTLFSLAVSNTAPFERPGVTSNTNSAAFSTYTCAWGPNDLAGTTGVTPVASTMPWMVRITIRVDDPNGRLPDGQTMEFVYPLPH